MTPRGIRKGENGKVDGRTDGRADRLTDADDDDADAKLSGRKRCVRASVVGSSRKISKLKLFASSKGRTEKTFCQPSIIQLRSLARPRSPVRPFVLSLLRHRELEGGHIDQVCPSNTAILLLSFPPASLRRDVLQCRGGGGLFINRSVAKHLFMRHHLRHLFRLVACRRCTGAPGIKSSFIFFSLITDLEPGAAIKGGNNLSCVNIGICF